MVLSNYNLGSNYSATKARRHKKRDRYELNNGKAPLFILSFNMPFIKK